jgi:uncharacterized Tic20 family protein
MAGNPNQAPPPIRPLSSAASQLEREARLWNMLCHLTALAGFTPMVFEIGDSLLYVFYRLPVIVGPLLVWQFQKNKFPSVCPHGQAAVNFQLTMLAAMVPLSVSAYALSNALHGFLLMLASGGIGFASIGFAILASYKAFRGQDYKYPFSIAFLK